MARMPEITVVIANSQAANALNRAREIAGLIASASKSELSSELAACLDIVVEGLGAYAAAEPPCSPVAGLGVELEPGITLSEGGEAPKCAGS